MSWCFRWLVGCVREPAHRGVLGRAAIPDIDPPSILALLDSQPLRTSRGYGINHLSRSDRISGDDLGSVPCVVVLVVGREVAESVVDLELRALCLEQVAGVAQHRRVVGAAEAAADAEHPHRATPALTAAARPRASPRWRGPARRLAAGCSS